MDEKEITRFSDQIWVTRVSRVNAEKRLLRDESIVQTANIYYSIITLLASVYLLKTNNNKARQHNKFGFLHTYSYLCSKFKA